MRQASFFSGAEGVGLGLAAAGIETVSVSEIEPYACALLAERLPGVPNLGDITAIDPEVIPDAELWTGGFPCQDLSTAGPRRGFGGGTRSVLAFAFLDLVERRRPPAFVLENVPGLLDSHGGRDLGRLAREVAELGYGWAFRVLDAQFFGVPQRRRRLLFVALRSDQDDPAGHRSAERAGAILSVGTLCPRHPAARNPARPTDTARPRGRAANDGGVAGTLQGPSPHGEWPNGAEAVDGMLIVAGETSDPGRDGTPSGLAGRLDDLDRVAPTINAPSQGGWRYDADQVETLIVEPEWHSGVDLRIRPGDIAPALTTHSGSRRTDRGVLLVGGFSLRGRSEGNVPEPFDDVAPTLRGSAGGSTRPFVYVKRGRAQTNEDAESWDEADVAPTINLFDVGDVRATVAIDGTNVEDDPLLPDGIDTARYRLTGNGVAAPVARWLGHRLAVAIAVAA